MGEARYSYAKLDERMAIVIYHPESYQGRSDVGLLSRGVVLDFLSLQTSPSDSSMFPITL